MGAKNALLENFGSTKKLIFTDINYLRE